MSEFPVFVPYGGEHIAAVVATPDAGPLGLVVLATGLGAPRSHRYQVWAVAARRLAERGVASVRFDYPGLHDSTGSPAEIRTNELPIDETIEVVRFARAVIGGGKVMAVGNCWGAQLALMLAGRIDECIAAMCILPETAQPGSMRSALRRAARGKVVDMVRSNQLVRRLLGPLKDFDMRTRTSIRQDLARALQGSDVLFLYDEENLESGPHATGKIRAMVDRLPEAQRSRFELRVTREGGLARFGTVGVQDTVVRTVVEWAERCFGPEGLIDPAHSAPVSGAAGPGRSGA
jgi:pimeloyl-ACP methyl ester carboxylesterase